MVATQHGSSTKYGANIIGTDNSTKGKKVETTIHHVKQPQVSVRMSMIKSLNEEMEIRLFRFSVFCSLFQSEKRSNPGMCVLWGPLTECDWQNECCMWRMRAAVGISDRGK